MEKQCSYLIFTDRITTYAQNCDTGTIDYSGTIAATVINSAIAALTNGGLVFIHTHKTNQTTTHGRRLAS